jgi:hypothetical protein
MAHQHNDQHEGTTPAHSHDCGGLFGCGDEKGTGVLREDIKESAFDGRALTGCCTLMKSSRSLCLVQHRGQLPGDAGRRHRARRPRDDPEKSVTGELRGQIAVV